MLLFLDFMLRKFGINIESPLPEYLHKVIVPATEWFLMDVLRGGQENNIQFCESYED